MVEIQATRNTRILKMNGLIHYINDETGTEIFHGPASAFSDLYYEARKKENRIYTDEQLNNLPEIERTHPYYNEWQVRKQTAQKLTTYLMSFNKNLKILEVGCGNGWLSAKLAGIPGSIVVGCDINKPELQQAKRVFNNQYNLRFAYGDIRFMEFFEMQFDIIVFAASIQYFPTLDSIISSALKMLDKKGEIHLVDSHIYRTEAISNAKKRTTEYYCDLGLPEMADHYFHHNIADLSAFNHSYFSKGESRINKLLRKPSLFPWIRIKHF
ncbi:MAG: hypothetical protein JWN76_1103 [Chitinophagaceae bacterium]|nr:hypothetical protein [Chitinophagaceae bacterium]